MRLELAKVLLVGQYAGTSGRGQRSRYLSKSELEQLDLHKLLRYVRANLDEINVRNLCYIIKGLAIVYHEQARSLEVNSRDLLKDINGDNAYSHFVRSRRDVVNAAEAAPVSSSQTKRKRRAQAAAG